MPRNSEQVLTEWLVMHAQSGNGDALEQLLKLWYPKLLRYAAGQTRGRDAAKDVVQEALLSAARLIRQLKDPAAFPNWLYRILQRRIVDHLRTELRHRHATAGDIDSGAAEPGPGTPLEDALESLAAESHQVVHLHYLIGLSLKEIAAIIDVPEGTVKSRLYSARAQLRTLLTERLMSDIDRRILEAIKADTDATMKGYERDLGLFGLIAESFKGALRWAVIGAIAMQVVLAAAFIYCAVRLFGTDDPAAKLDWLALGLAAFIALGLLRLWFFMEINRLSIAREIKRLEFQVAAVANALKTVCSAKSAT